MEGETTLEDRQQYLQHDRQYKGNEQDKGGQSLLLPKPPWSPESPTPVSKGSPQKRGHSPPPAPVAEDLEQSRGVQGGETAADTASCHMTARGNGVSRQGTCGELRAEPELEFSVEQICGEFGLTDVVLDYSGEVRDATLTLKMFEKSNEVQIQAGRPWGSPIQAEDASGGQVERVKPGDQRERSGPTAPKKRGRRLTPQDVNAGTSKELPAGGLHFPQAEKPDAKHKLRDQREEGRGTSPTKSPGDFGRVVPGEGHGPGSHISGSPQTKQGQVLNNPDEPRREEETRKSGPSTGKQEEGEISSLHSPIRGLEREKQQEVQTSDQEDIESLSWYGCKLWWYGCTLSWYGCTLWWYGCTLWYGESR